jgi:hypothetical protein
MAVQHVEGEGGIPQRRLGQPMARMPPQMLSRSACLPESISG